MIIWVTRFLRYVITYLPRLPQIRMCDRVPSLAPPQILGIMNGTTNFMLTKMESGADYGEVLAEAQALGYAEGRRFLFPAP